MEITQMLSKCSSCAGLRIGKAVLQQWQQFTINDITIHCIPLFFLSS